MFTVYILYSPKTDQYYVGQTEDLEARLECHKEKLFAASFTAKTEDWVLFFRVDGNSRRQAVNMEKHIKRMKSKKYIENLKVYPEISERLLHRYQ